MSQLRTRLSNALLVMAFIIIVTVIVAWLLGYIERPVSMLSGAVVIVLLAVVGRRRARTHGPEA